MSLKYLIGKIQTLILTLVLILSFTKLSLAAEKIDFYYGLIEFPIKIEDLKLFADKGQITKQLAFYLNFLEDDKKEEFKKVLKLKYPVNPVIVYRMSRTSVGEKLAKRLGDIIQIPEEINGFYGIRGALIKAATDSKGVSIVSFLENFPTDIRIDIQKLLTIINEIEQSKSDTKQLINQIKQESEKITFNNDFSQTNLSTLGEFEFKKETLNLFDSNRNRTLTTDFYLPLKPKKFNSTPIIVISNGVGSKRERFTEMAEHLASYGFAVINPEHPGSNRQRQKDFIKGLYRENFDATDFIDRPLDITYILDYLEKINQTKLENQLNTKEVGIFGYSFGGPTALALAGAQINFTKLQQDCNKPLDLLNISLLYQCRALEVKDKNQSLKDTRIKAAFLFVPFSNSIFGKEKLSQISLPIMWQIVPQDFLTSVQKEQLPAFNGLSGNDKYLVISENLPHSFITLDDKQSSSKETLLEITNNYQNVLSLVFFQTYIAHNQDYLPYLSSKYFNYISKNPYNLYLLAPSAKSNQNKI